MCKKSFKRQKQFLAAVKERVMSAIFSVAKGPNEAVYAYTYVCIHI